MKNLNLDEISKRIAVARANQMDDALAGYVFGAIARLNVDKHDVTKYTLVQVDNPLEMKSDGVRISQSWRVVKISDVQDRPSYVEDDF